MSLGLSENTSTCDLFPAARECCHQDETVRMWSGKWLKWSHKETHEIETTKSQWEWSVQIDLATNLLWYTNFSEETVQWSITDKQKQRKLHFRITSKFNTIMPMFTEVKFQEHIYFIDRTGVLLTKIKIQCNFLQVFHFQSFSKFSFFKCPDFLWFILVLSQSIGSNFQHPSTPLNTRQFILSKSNNLGN